MKKLLIGVAAVLGIAGVVGVSSLSASAMYGPRGNGNESGTAAHVGGGNGYQTSLESRAEVVGMTAEELQVALETKTMSQIADEQGLSEEAYEAKMEEAARARWEARGLSAEEIAQRTADREARQAANHEDHEWASGDGDHTGCARYGQNRS